MARPTALGPSGILGPVPSRSDVRNTSILEVMIIIVFVVLILLSDAYGENNRLNEEAREIEERLRSAEISALGRSELEEGFTRAVTQIEELEATVAELQAIQSTLAASQAIHETLLQTGLLPPQAEDPVETLERIGEALDGLRDTVAGDQADPEILLQEAVEALDLAERSEIRTDSLRQSLGLDPDAPVPTVLQTAEERLNGLTSDLSAAQTQIERMAEAEADRLRKLRGWVPCWPTGENGYDFTYSITMYDSRFVVQPGWPDHRDGEVQASSILTPPDNFLSREAFRHFANPVFEQGVNHPTDCRYVVRAYDKTTNKDSYKTQLGILRRFFIYVEQ